MEHHTLFPDLQLLSQAFAASVTGIIIADAQQLDMPIIYVNPAFGQLSGYPAAETVGRNCRFLQGQDRDQDARREIREALAQGRSITTVLRNYRKNGTMFYNELTLSPIRDAAGIITHFVGFQNDVTAREEALRGEAQAHEHLSTTLSRMTDGFISFDSNLNFTYLNAAAASIVGKRPEDLTGHNLLMVFPEFADSAVTRALHRAETTGTVQNAVSYLEPSGKWLEATIYPAEDGVSVFTRDVTESHQAQRALQVSEERFTKVFEASPVPIIVSQLRSGHYLDVNPEFLHQSGYSREEVIGRTALDLNFWVDPLAWEEGRRTLREQGKILNREVQFRLKSGAVADTVVSVVPVTIVGEACLVTLIRDITLEKRARQTLAESGERHRQIAAELQRTLDLSLDLITSFDAEGRFVTVSAACQQILGYAPEELIGCAYLDFVHPDDQTITRQADDSMTAGRATTTFQNRYLHRNGAVVWMEWTAVMLPGDPLMYCVARDVTQRRAAEEDQAFLAAIVQASHNAIIGASLDDTIRSWNPGAEELYGYTAAEALGQPLTLIIPLELRAEEAETLRRAGQGERPEPFESVRIAKDGRRIPVFITVSPIFGVAGRVVGVSKITRDITSLREAEREVQALNQDLRAQLTHVTGLREVDQSIAASAELGVTLGLILDNITQQLTADAVLVQLLDPHTLTLEYAVARGFTTALHDLTLRLGEGLGGQVALNRQPLFIADLRVADLPPAWKVMLEKERIMAYYGAPIIAKSRVLGVITVLHRKPFAPSAVWLETFDVLGNQAAIAVDSSWLFTELERRNLELRLAYDETIEGWARALDLRDHETEGHSRRVTEMTVALSRLLGAPPEQLVQVRRGALLHDIGKMGIPDAVLLKPGKLTDDEWTMMKKHPAYAVDLLLPIEYLRPALDIPQYHHEKWDGSGYPLGLKGKAIPMTARAFAVVDVYDALTCDRPYRKAWTREKAVEHIQNGAGTHFDPTVVQVFVHMLQGS